MTPTARIQAALDHRRPDRLPRYEIFFQAFIDAWRQWRGVGPDADIYSHYPAIDIGTVLACQGGPFPEREEQWEDAANRYVRDSWGRLSRHSKTGRLFEVVETAIREPADLDHLPFRDPRGEDRADLARLADRTAPVRERFAPVGGVMGLFMPSYYLRGELQFLMDLTDDPPFVHALIGRVAEFITALGERVLDVTGARDTALWVYDDFGSNNGPLVSPRMFETFFLPAYKRMIATWKAAGLTHVILHYDANCWVILDMLIEAGFTGIQGIYPGAGMTIPAVKARYGNRLALIGGICNTSVLAPGPRAAIEANAAAVAEVAHDGGVIVGAHSIEEDIPPAHYDHYARFLDAVDRRW